MAAKRVRKDFMVAGVYVCGDDTSVTMEVKLSDETEFV
jgi:hypothetical protein